MKSLSQKQLKLLSEILQLGQRAIQLGALTQAEKHFSDALKINPQNIEAQGSLAFVYATNKQHVKASALLKDLLKSIPKHVQTHFNLANSLYEQKLYDEAIEYYQNALKIDSKYVDAYIHCGIAYRAVRNYDAAIKCLHQALNLDKANAKAFHVLGAVYGEINDMPHALECLENAVGLMPQQPQYRVSFAEMLGKAGLDFEAGLMLHKACELNPTYADGFIGYGQFLLEHLRHDEALECFNHAAQLNPSDLNVLDRIGKTYLGMGNVDAALKQYNLALLQDPTRINSLLGIGQVYLETGKTNAVFEVANKVCKTDITLPSGYLLLSKAKKSTITDGLAEHLLGFANKDDLNESNKVATNFALGKIFDDQKNYAEAFKHYAAGNALKYKTLTYSPEADAAKCERLITFFNADFFKTQLHLGTDKSLPIVIVGMPRSGTTLTEQIISSHPSVIGAGEVLFWSKTPTALPLRLSSQSEYPACLNEMTSAQAKDIAGIYEETLRKIVGSSSKALRITDKMPHNFLNVGMIALLFPHVKIIHTKRDPIDTCLSIFFQNFNKSHAYASDLNNIGFHYKQYERMMQHWHEVLPGRIMDINYEDTIADPEYWSRKLIAHIGLEWDDACLSPHKLERTVKTASLWQVRQPIYKTSVQRWKNYEQFLEPLKTALGIRE